MPNFRNSIISILSILALSGTSYAGGDIEPVEPVVVPDVDNSAFYIGLGFGQSYLNNDFTNEKITSNTAMLQVGYQYNAYVALEGRYTFGFNTDYDVGNTGNLSSDYDGDFTDLWKYHLAPLLNEYLRGLPNANDEFAKLEMAYNLKEEKPKS